MLARRCTLLLASVALLFGAVGCASARAEFATKYAPNVRRQGMTVSVFGVYKDGRLSADSWTDIAPRFAPVMGGAPCDSLQTDAIVMEDRDVATALDDATRSDGVSDELLDVFAPAAAGDAILLVTIAGHPPGESPQISAGGGQPASFSTHGKIGRSIGGPPRTDPSATSGPSSFRSSSSDVFEVSATLFSIQDHHTVALVAMSYTGKSVDEAMGFFVARLRSELPGMQCKGWKPGTKIEADRVRTARPSE